MSNLYQVDSMERVFVRALRELTPGEELTFNYGFGSGSWNG